MIFVMTPRPALSTNLAPANRSRDSSDPIGVFSTDMNEWHLRVLHTFSSMTSLELLIQQSAEEVDEFRQHEGVVTVMVK